MLLFDGVSDDSAEAFSVCDSENKVGCIIGCSES